MVVGIIKNDNDEYLITKRKKDQLLGGLWEFPGGKVKDKETYEGALARELKEELGISPDITTKLCSVKHAYSHFKVTIHAFMCHSNDTNIQLASADDHQWISFDDFAFPKANKVIIENLMNIDNLC